MLAKPIAEMSLEDLRNSENRLRKWLEVEVDLAKMQALRRQLDAVLAQLKRRKRR